MGNIPINSFVDQDETSLKIKIKFTHGGQRTTDDGRTAKTSHNGSH